MADANPLVEAEKNGTVYTHTGEEQDPYILIRLRPNAEEADVMDISVDAEGMDNLQVLHILEALIEQHKETLGMEQPRRPIGFSA